MSVLHGPRSPTGELLRCEQNLQLGSSLCQEGFVPGGRAGSAREAAMAVDVLKLPFGQLAVGFLSTTLQVESELGLQASTGLGRGWGGDSVEQTRAQQSLPREMEKPTTGR